MIIKMNNSLELRIVVMTFLLLFTILAIMTSTGIVNQNEILLRKSSEEANAFAEVIATALRHPMLLGDQDVIQRQFDNYKLLKDVVVIHLVDDKGIIRRSTDISLIGQRPSIAYLDELLLGKEHQGVEKRLRTGQQVYAKASPIFNEPKCFNCHGREKKVLGGLRIALDWNDEILETSSNTTRNILISFIGLLVLTIVITVFLRRIVIMPIKVLEKGIQKVAGGDLEYKIDTRSQDELGKLAGMFNQMTSDLASAMDKEKFLLSNQEQKNAELEKLNRILVQEVANRKRAEENLQLVNQRLADIIEFFPDATLVIDRERRVIAWNKAMEELTGVAKEEMVGKSDYAYSVPFYGEKRPVLIDYVFSPDPEIAKKYEFLEKRGNVMFSEVFIPRVYKGRGAYLWIMASPLLDHSGNVAGAIETIRDITERKKQEEKLRDAMDTKSRFTSIVSHELRTPLTAIKEGINIVLDGSAGGINPEQKDFLDTAKRNVDRLARLINDVLDFQKLEADRMQFDFRQNDINETVREIHQMMSVLVKSKNLELLLNLEEPLPLVRFDRDKIIQVLTNLVNNAVKFTEKGSITIETKKADIGVCVTITDTGMGIRQEDLSRLFTSFEQLGDAKDSKGGSGLGLAISKEIIEKHQGNIWVESVLDKGTKFSFILPSYGVEKSLNEIIGAAAGDAVASRNFILAAVRCNNYEEIKSLQGEEKARKFMHRISECLVGNLEEIKFAALRTKEETVVLARVDKKSEKIFKDRMRLAIKAEAFAFSEADFDFSYGFANYPQEAESATSLLDKAYSSLVSDLELRKSRKILIADDDPEVMATLQKILEKWGYQNVVQAANGQQALEKADSEHPDLLILDMQMPAMSGYEVIGRLKGELTTKDIPILIISGYAVKVERIKDYFAKEAIPMISKPFDAGQLEKWLCYLL